MRDFRATRGYRVGQHQTNDILLVIIYTAETERNAVDVEYLIAARM